MILDYRWIFLYDRVTEMLVDRVESVGGNIYHDFLELENYFFIFYPFKLKILYISINFLWMLQNEAEWSWDFDNLFKLISTS